jgi:RNA polymerase-binding transcription factor DksA
MVSKTLPGERENPMNHTEQLTVQQACRTALHKEYQNTLSLLDSAKSYIIRECMGDAIQISLKPQILLKKERIERAYDRIYQGTYGQCCRCGQPLWERLQAIPYAELCIQCQQKYEQVYQRLT